MFTRTFWLATVFAMALPFSARAAELLMFESILCEWCDIWQEDVGQVYDRTPEAAIAPLRRVDIDDPRPADLSYVGAVTFTPTFVLVEDGEEVGRIIGYPGESHFWSYLGVILKRLNAPSEDGCPQTGDKVAGLAGGDQKARC